MEIINHSENTLNISKESIPEKPIIVNDYCENGILTLKGVANLNETLEQLHRKYYRVKNYILYKHKIPVSFEGVIEIEENSIIELAKIYNAYYLSVKDFNSIFQFPYIPSYLFNIMSEINTFLI